MMLKRQKTVVKIMWTSIYQNMTFDKLPPREIHWLLSKLIA